MSALGLLKSLLGGQLPANILGSVHLDHWTVSRNGKRLGPVTQAKIGLKEGDHFWGEFAFAESAGSAPGVTHLLTCERPLRGGDSLITLDILPVVGHVAFTTHLTGFPPQVRLEIDVALTGAARYRFDATVEG